MILTKIQQEKIRRKFKLSNQEMKIVKYIFEGCVTDIDLSKRMNVSLLTTKGYLHSIYLKTRTGKKISALLKCLDCLDL